MELNKKNIVNVFFAHFKKSKSNWLQKIVTSRITWIY